jgi:hypothetical protein
MKTTTPEAIQALLFLPECLLPHFFVPSHTQSLIIRNISMATVAPSTVKQSDPSSLEKIAYESVKAVPTKEPNDQYRLGYHIWNHLKEHKGTVAEAVKHSGARILIPEKEATAIIEAALKEKSS